MTNTPKPQANGLEDILSNVNEILDDAILSIKLGVTPQLVGVELKQQLLAEVLDMIGGWYKYPSKALPGDEEYLIAEAINKVRAEYRKAAKEMFKL